MSFQRPRDAGWGSGARQEQVLGVGASSASAGGRRQGKATSGRGSLRASRGGWVKEENEDWLGKRTQGVSVIETPRRGFDKRGVNTHAKVSRQSSRWYYKKGKPKIREAPWVSSQRLSSCWGLPQGAELRHLWPLRASGLTGLFPPHQSNTEKPSAALTEGPSYFVVN